MIQYLPLRSVNQIRIANSVSFGGRDERMEGLCTNKHINSSSTRVLGGDKVNPYEIFT